MLHLDLPPPNLLPDPFTKVIFDGDAFYNNEPFWMRMHDLDWAADDGEGRLSTRSSWR